MPYLRVQLLGLQAQEPWRYYVALTTLEPCSTAATAQVQRGLQAGAALPPDLVCRTDTARPSRTPEFTSRSFLLRLPAAAAAQSSTHSSSPYAVDSGQEPAAKLAVSLFAVPSVEAPAGPIIAGQEVDRLVASAQLHLEQQLLQRLGAGEQVAVPLPLQEVPDCKVQQMPEGMGSQAAQLQSLRKSQQVPYNSSKPHVLLELMLLQAEAPGALSASMQSLYQQATAAAAEAEGMLLGSSYDSRRDDSMFQASAAAAPATAGGDAGGGSEGDVELLVLVSAASNVPLVPGAQGQLEPPSVMVALRSGIDASNKGPPQASTSAAAPSTNPLWGELLTVKCQEAQLSHSRLQLSLVSSSTNRVLAKGSLKLSGLLPGQHYSFALSLTDSCILYITVVLGFGSETLLSALQGSGLVAAAAETAGRLQLVQMALPQLQQPLQSLLSDAVQQQAAGYEIWAIWRCTGSNGEQQRQQQSQQQPVYIQLDGREGSEAASAAMLRVYNSNNGLLAVGGPSRAGSAASSRDAAAVEAAEGSSLKGLGGVLAVVPLYSADQEVPWPQPHQVILPMLLSGITTATVELYLQPYPGSSGNSKGASSSSKLPPAVCFALLTLPIPAIASQAAGKPCQLTLPLSCNPKLTADAAGAKVSIQVLRWVVQRYVNHLTQLARQQEQQRQQQQQQQMPALLTSPSPVPPPGGSLKAKGGKAAAAAAAAATAASMQLAPRAVQQQGGTVELLLGDLLAKQQALERLQRQLDLVGQCAEAADGRIAELQAANSNLSADLQHLRQLLHEEKEASASATSHLDSSQPHLLPGTHIALETATREQVLQQLTVVLGKHATERARNGELVRRLQQLHAEKVDVMELQRQYLELQEAHFTQSKLLVDQETHQNTLATLKKAVTDQEALITRLQQLLSSAAARNKELEVWKASANTLQQEVTKLREELSNMSAAGAAAEQQAAAQAAAAALADSQAAAAQAAAAFDAQLISKESERLSAVMRADTAETSAVAAQNELLEVTKRYAREIAQLKTKLAEKDAQLLGGFGSIDHLTAGPFDSPGAAEAAGADAALGGFSPGAFNLGALAGLPALHELGLPGSNVGYLAAAPLPAAAAAGVANGQYSSPPRGYSSDAGSSGSPRAAAAAAGGRGSPRLPDALALGGGRSQRQNSNSLAAAAAAGAAGTELAGSASGRGLGQQGSYTLRAGSAEARLMHQSTGEAQRQGPGSGSRSSKPGSPLLPTAQQQRLTNSADGVRSPGGVAMPGSFSRGSPTQQQIQHQGRVSREVGAQQAWGSPRLQQQKHWAQQEQQQQWDGVQQLEGAEDEDEYEDVEDEEGQEVQPAATHGRRQDGSSSSQQLQQQEQQQVTSPKKRGGLAGFFSRG